MSSGSVSQAACDRMPDTSAARKAAVLIAPGVAADNVNACTATDAARPGASLSGRTAVNQ